MKAITTLAVAAYVTAVLLTFGYGVNRVCVYDYEAKIWNEGCDRAEDAAIYFAIFWPLYWAARGAIEITKP